MAFIRSVAALSKLRSRVVSVVLWKCNYIVYILFLFHGLSYFKISAYEGIDSSIPECQKVLPAAKSDGEPLLEGLLWFLLNGKVPSKQQVDALSKELQNRATVPGVIVPHRP